MKNDNKIPIACLIFAILSFAGLIFFGIASSKQSQKEILESKQRNIILYKIFEMNVEMYNKMSQSDEKKEEIKRNEENIENLKERINIYRPIGGVYFEELSLFYRDKFTEVSEYIVVFIDNSGSMGNKGFNSLLRKDIAKQGIIKLFNFLKNENKKGLVRFFAFRNINSVYRYHEKWHDVSKYSDEQLINDIDILYKNYEDNCSPIVETLDDIYYVIDSMSIENCMLIVFSDLKLENCLKRGYSTIQSDSLLLISFNKLNSVCKTLIIPTSDASYYRTTQVIDTLVEIAQKKLSQSENEYKDIESNIDSLRTEVTQLFQSDSLTIEDIKSNDDSSLFRILFCILFALIAISTIWHIISYSKLNKKLDKITESLKKES